MSNLGRFSDPEKKEKFAAFSQRDAELKEREEQLFCEQRTLDEKVISWRLRYKVSLDIAKGIRHLHSIVPPVVHRDLRSPNVFLVNLMTLDPEAPVCAKVADFGLSRQASPNLNQMLPTWKWLAPEVIDANSSGYDQRADVYSFGVVLWELATNMDSPFGEFKDQVPVIKQRIIQEGLRPTIPESCPPEFASLIKSCWATNPSLRPSFEEIVDKLSKMMGLAEQPSEMDETL
jgi:serine/threonine protein kinase